MARKAPSPYVENVVNKAEVEARQAEARRQSMERLMADYQGPRACQERRCASRAAAGSDFCEKHGQMTQDTIRRVGRVNNLRVRAR